MKPLLLALPLLSIPAPAAQAADDADDLAALVGAWLAPLDEAGELSGTVLVARGEEVLFQRAYGYADREHAVPNRVTTRHCIASITKPMTVIIALRLMEEEKLAPGDLLEKWIPGFPNGDRITVEHLLNHRAGIPHRVTTLEQETVPRTAEDMVELAREAELLFEPGEQSVYSSAGFSVLARVLELAGGMPYEDLLQHYVCEPAGLERTLHTNQRAIVPDRARDYLPGVDCVRKAPLRDYSFLVGAGSVYSTAEDLLRLVRAVVNGDLGELVRANIVRGRLSFGWNGATGGFRAFADHSTVSDVTVVFTGNLPSGANDRLRDALPRLVAGEDVLPPERPQVRPTHAPAVELARFEGLYELRPGSTMEVRAVEGGLTVNDWILIATGERTFWSPQDYAQVEAVLREDGTVERLQWGANPMPRVGDLPE